MIASLNFDKQDYRSRAEAPFEPGLRRIDEILPAVLARYACREDADLWRRSLPCLAVKSVALNSELAKAHPK